MSATPQGRTAARPRFVLMTEDKAALLKIVGRHFDGHTIANQGLDPVLLHLACRVGHDLLAGIEVNAHQARSRSFPSSSRMPRPIRVRSAWHRPATERSE